jgi:DNA-binding transcriptional LysR family regulator
MLGERRSSQASAVCSGVAAAAPDYLRRRGKPIHPRELLEHGCIRVRFASGALEALLEDGCSGFSGPFLYYSGRRHMPAPLRAFVDFMKTAPEPCL